MLVDKQKYSLKCPYRLDAEFLVIHNTYNDASADGEIKYMISNNTPTSYHFAIDNKEVVQGIPLNRNAWHAGDGVNGDGNRKGIGIEICYSRSGGGKFLEAEKLAAKFVAQLLQEYGWGINRVKKHQDFSRKYCPHRTLDTGWERFLKMIEGHLLNEKKSVKDNIITIKINSQLVNVNGVNEDGVVFIFLDKLKIPVRLLFESLGYSVKWNDIIDCVEINGNI